MRQEELAISEIDPISDGPSSGRVFLIAWLVAAGVVALDLVTKRWAAIHFVDAPVVVIPGALRFTYTENSGAAFSMFQDAGVFLGLAALVAVVAMVWSLRKVKSMPEVVGLGMIMGGALGNLIDRVARGVGLFDGHVIDWIQFPNFPVFNLADSSITVAVGLLLIASWRSERSTKT